MSTTNIWHHARPHEAARRSRTDWLAITGDQRVADLQEAYERRATALALRRIGKTFAEIGEYIGCSNTRASQLVQRAQSSEGKLSPIEVWVRSTAFIAHTLPEGIQYRPRRARRLAQTLTPFVCSPKRDWLLVASRGPR